MTTYHVKVTTGDVWGAGTDANVFIILYGDLDNTGKHAHHLQLMTMMMMSQLDWNAGE